MAGSNFFRPTGALVSKNFRFRGSIPAPGFAEQTVPGPLTAGGPRASPTQARKSFLRTVGAAPCGRTRAGLGPAPTRERNSFCIRRRGGYQPPARLHPSREKVPSVCEADEGGLRNGSSPSAGRPVSGPYEKEGTASRFAAGAGPRPTRPRDPIPCRAQPPGRAAPDHSVGAAHRAARDRPDEDIGPCKNAAVLVSPVPLSRT